MNRTPNSPLMETLKSFTNEPEQFTQALHDLGYVLVKKADLHKQRILASPVSRHYPISEAVVRLHSLGPTHMKPLRYLAEAGATLTITSCHEELGVENLPTKLSEIHEAIGIYCDRERNDEGFNVYSLSPEDREYLKQILKADGGIK